MANSNDEFKDYGYMPQQPPAEDISEGQIAFQPPVKSPEEDNSPTNPNETNTKDN